MFIMTRITSELNYRRERTTFLAQAQSKNVLDAAQWAKYILKYFNWKLVTAVQKSILVWNVSNSELRHIIT